MDHVAIGEFQYLLDIRRQLEGAGHGQKGALIERAARFLCVSRQELYRKLEKAGYKVARKRRSDRGSSAASLEDLRFVANVLMRSQRNNGKRLMTMRMAIDLAQKHGRFPEGMSPTHLTRLLIQNHLHPDQLNAPSPHVEQRSLHPNHCWQVDASICVLYYLRNDGLAVMDEKKFYKNKPANVARIESQRVIRYLITDHTSGAFYLRYVFGSENSENLITTFMEATCKRDGDPFHGVPFLLSMDAGSANLAHVFQNLLELLEVRPVPHLKNPRANGQVESTNNLVERQFESRLAFAKIENLAELNERATQWRLAYCATAIHTRHKQTRYAMWMTIKQEQLRIAPAPELYRELVTTKPVEVTVSGNLTVRYSIPGYGSNEYDVRFVPGVNVRGKFTVVVNPYRAPDIDVLARDEHGNLDVHTLSPLKRDTTGWREDSPVLGGEFKPMPDTVTDRHRKQLLKEAYGVETQREAEDLVNKRAIPFAGKFNPYADIEGVEIPTYLPKRGTELDVQVAGRTLQPLTHTAAAKAIRALGVNWMPFHMRLLEERYPDNAVPAELIEALAKEFSTRTGATVTRLAGGADV